jgi:hypothetical protein
MFIDRPRHSNSPSPQQTARGGSPSGLGEGAAEWLFPTNNKQQTTNN